ncbi:hypothetical protein C8Q80DRAFT_1095598 [Daedaleopsis nitida]|nr:hypothetical protein C8Q80DRAFT_1095598 [Daedaleopsis nitida]
MGRSAKFLKRQNKKTTSTARSVSQPTVTPTAKQTIATTTIQEQKKRAGLKEKAKASKHRRDGDGPVLGGADYVELMLGSRRKAAVEAAKLPTDSEP